MVLSLVTFERVMINHPKRSRSQNSQGDLPTSLGSPNESILHFRGCGYETSQRIRIIPVSMLITMVSFRGTLRIGLFWTPVSMHGQYKWLVNGSDL